MDGVALAAVARKSDAVSVCLDAQSWGSVHGRCFHWGLERGLQRHGSLRAVGGVQLGRACSAQESPKLMECRLEGGWTRAKCPATCVAKEGGSER